MTDILKDTSKETSTMVIDAKEVTMYDNALEEHFKTYDNRRPDYIDAVIRLFDDVQLLKNISLSNKSRILVVLLMRMDRDTFTTILPNMDLPELVRACEMLDSNRFVRQLEKKLEKRSNYHWANKVKLLKELNEGDTSLSLTSTRVKMIKSWVKQLNVDQLVYRAIMYPPDNWRKLADLTHLNPKRDFSIDWFLPYCFGTPAPTGSIVDKVNSMTADTFSDVYEEYQLPYECVRMKMKDWTNNFSGRLSKAKLQIARRERLKTLLWYWHELTTPDVDAEIVRRLKEVDNVDLSYGKLVDLLMKVGSRRTKPTPLFTELLRITERRTKQYELSLPTPITVFGDASASMQVAINTSSIITSLLCALAKAELHLFKNTDIPVAQPPSDVQSAIEFAHTMQATNSTSPASSLWPYYRQKKVVKTFIIVTDEEENTSHTGYQSWGYWTRDNDATRGYMFPELYRKYCEEVYPARLIFISFTNPNVDGMMAAALKKEIGEKRFSEFVEVFKFNAKNPDLNRLDFVLEKMCIDRSVNNTTQEKVVCL